MGFGAYEIEKVLGRGGMGKVFLARHRETGARRAIKVMDAPGDPTLVERFQREAEVLARVGGSGVVPVHELGVESGRPFYVMGFMPGGSLEGLLRARGRVPWAEAAGVVARLARVLGACHAAGVVHRDLKPANILFDDRGEPRLADFGCARDLASASLTATGVTLGTPGYMAPEVLDGEKGAAPADVFALGVILHQLVVGSLPFKGQGIFQLLAATRAGKRPPLTEAGAPGVLEEIARRALDPKPEKRPSAAALARELDGLVAGAGAKRSKAWLLAPALGVALLGVLVAARGRPPERAPPPPSPVAELASRVPAEPKPDPEARFRAAIAVLESARTLDDFERARAEIAASGPGIERKLADALACAIGVQRVFDDLDARALPDKEQVEKLAHEFELLLEDFDARPDLIVLAARPLIAGARRQLLRRVPETFFERFGTFLKGCPRLARERDRLPAALALVCITSGPDTVWRKELGEAGLDRLAGALSEDPVLAGHAHVFCLEWKGTNPERHWREAERLLLHAALREPSGDEETTFARWRLAVAAKFACNQIIAVVAATAQDDPATVARNLPPALGPAARALEWRAWGVRVNDQIRLPADDAHRLVALRIAIGEDPVPANDPQDAEGQLEPGDPILLLARGASREELVRAAEGRSRCVSVAAFRTALEGPEKWKKARAVYTWDSIETWLDGIALERRGIR